MNNARLSPSSGSSFPRQAFGALLLTLWLTACGGSEKRPPVVEPVKVVQVRRQCLTTQPPVPPEGAGEPTDEVVTPTGVVSCPPEFEACYMAAALILEADWIAALWAWAESAYRACGPEE